MNTENSFKKGEFENDFFRFLEIKTEKLVTAVYLITNFLSDKEPIKWKLRDLCLETLSSASVLKEKNPTEKANLLTSILSKAGEIVSLLEIAHVSGFISEMNYTVLKREYMDVIELIESREEVKKTVNKVSLPATFFEDTKYQALGSGADKHVAGFATGNGEDRVARPEGFRTNAVSGRENSSLHQRPMYDVKDNRVTSQDQRNDFLNGVGIKDIVAAKIAGGADGQVLGRVEQAKNKRRDMILQMVKDKNDLTIKDIANQITDCSEKTIQRELVAMVESGTLKRTGERRWSRYSLA